MKLRNTYHEPLSDCSFCPRLVAYRRENEILYPHFFNAPVQSIGSLSAELILVGLAPGVKGANQTGRPFTGDHAGDLLYQTLSVFGFLEGNYKARVDDGLKLVNCRITNAVKCVPPKNKPIGVEVSRCGQYLASELLNMPNVKVILALGVLAHGAVLSALGERKNAKKFGHKKTHSLPNGLMLVNSYHCSRYNTNTGLLTVEMFEAVFNDIVKIIDK